MGKESGSTPQSKAPEPGTVGPAASNRIPPGPLGEGVPLSGYVDDIELMLEYCRDESKVASEVVKSSPAFKAPPVEYAAILEVHEQLSTLIHPATPRSLAATDFSWQRLQRDRRPWQTMILLATLLAVAVVGLSGYVRLSWAGVESPAGAMDDVNSRGSEASGVERPDTGRPGGKEEPPTTSTADANTVEPADASTAKDAPNTVIGGRRTQKGYLYAAMLGAALNGLFTVQRYIRKRTFLPNYALVYLIRLLVGIVAGVVLANFGFGLVKGNSTMSALGPNGIALLGGYSAEAVRKILDRLVEVLVTVVKGRDPAAEKLAVAQEMLSIADRKKDPGEDAKAMEEAVTEFIRNPEK